LRLMPPLQMALMMRLQAQVTLLRNNME